MPSDLALLRSHRRPAAAPPLLAGALPRRHRDALHSAPPSADRLESWKEIAAYLNRTIRTTQRWERCEALPVHRHFHSKGNSVYAFKHELHAWQSSRSPRAASARLAGPSRTTGTVPDWLCQLYLLCLD